MYFDMVIKWNGVILPFAWAIEISFFGGLWMKEMNGKAKERKSACSKFCVIGIH